MRHEIVMESYSGSWGGNNNSCESNSNSDQKYTHKIQTYSILNRGLCKESTGDHLPCLIFECIK